MVVLDNYVNSIISEISLICRRVSVLFHLCLVLVSFYIHFLSFVGANLAPRMCSINNALALAYAYTMYIFVHSHITRKCSKL